MMLGSNILAYAEEPLKGSVTENDNYQKKEVLPKPRTSEQRFVHMCDFLASRKFLDIKFENNEIVE